MIVLAMFWRRTGEIYRGTDGGTAGGWRLGEWLDITPIASHADCFSLPQQRGAAMEILIAVVELIILIWLLFTISSIHSCLDRIDKYCEWRVGVINKQNGKQDK
jgi:hypothetical protein